jgi:hypothetical protein
MRQRSGLVIAVWVVALVASGCMGQLGTEGAHVDSVSGALGEVDVTGTPELWEVSLRGDSLYVEIRRQDALGNHAMVGITIPRDTETERVAGTAIALLPENAELIGCSGPVPDDWEFDCTPDEYTVDIQNKADRIQVDFEGEFDCEGGAPDPTVEGSVDVDLI